MSSSVYECSLIKLPQIIRTDGSITPVHSQIEVPFDIRRIYYLYDVPGGEGRGGHAHKQLEQLIIAASGSFDLLLDDGRTRRTYSLNRPYHGVHIRAGIWRELHNFSSGGICLVLASRPYEVDDYIRDYNDFRAFRGVA